MSTISLMTQAFGGRKNIGYNNNVDGNDVATDK